MIAALAEQLFHGEAAKDLERKLRRQISHLEPFSAAARVAGLMACPELGANACRLEALLVEVLQHARGGEQLDDESLQELFRFMDSTAHARMEDPAEDVFVSLVMAWSHNFRVFEGTYEGNAFYLQRFIDAVVSMPRGTSFEQMRRSIRALLTLSETVADRAGIRRYTPGEELPCKEIPEEIAPQLSASLDVVRFSSDQLKELGISLPDLRPFLTKLKDWQCHSHTPDLEITPLLQDEGTIYILSPSHISPAIRRHVISFCAGRNELTNLQSAIVGGYSRLLRETPLLGDLKDLPTRWAERDGVLVADCVAEVDPGRFIHLLFVADDFGDAAQTGLARPGKAMSDAGNVIAVRIRDTARQFRAKASYREGLSLIVACGWGRGVMCSVPSASEAGWGVEFLSANDLITLSRVHRMNPLMLFRLRDHASALEAANVELRNINGLLNMYGWAEDCGRDLLPHDQISRDMVQGPMPLQVMITQNALFRVRSSVAQDYDTHIAATPEGESVRVSRYATQSYFSDEAREPVYGSFDDVLADRLKCVYEGAKLNVWLTASVEKSADRNHLFTVWDAFVKWLPIVVPVMEDHLARSSHSNIHWHISFPPFDSSSPPVVDPQATCNQLTSQIGIDAAANGSVVRITVPQLVYHAFHRVDNRAEKAILRALVRGTADLLDCRLDDTMIIDVAIPNPDAKQFHSFTAQCFADYVSHRLPSTPMMLEEFDESLTRLGLAWRAGASRETESITGVEQCTCFLNTAADAMWQDIRQLLSGLDRRAMLERLLLNGEALRRDDRVWKRTARAMLALNASAGDAHRRMADQAFKRNASIVNTRILMEMALCECAHEGGLTPGDLDVARLLSKVSVLTQIGGWSDGIRHDAITPEVRISALGIIQVDHTFHEGVVMPFGYGFAERQQLRAAEKYDEMCREAQAVPSTADLFEQEFQQAWMAEFGFAIDQGRRFLDDIEDRGRQLEQPVFALHRSELIGLRSKELSSDEATRILDELTLVARKQWDKPPDSFTMKDVVPWRYRRRLSAVFRPILQYDVADDPNCLVVPSFIRDGFVYRLDRTYRAEFDDSQFGSVEMKRWIGLRRHEAGHQFNHEVGERLRNLGWRCEVEISPPTLGIDVGDRDYGDVDVLAWHDQLSRVVVIECKDLMFAKTPGEIARQLREFRGKYDSHGQPDRLRRHLDRLELLQNNREAVSAYTGMSDAVPESALVFRNVVPIEFLDDAQVKRARVVYFTGLAQL